MTKKQTEEECGYCKIVARNHGGNTTFKCKRHTPRNINIKRQDFYKREQVDILIAEDRAKMQVAILKEIEMSMYGSDNFMSGDSYVELKGIIKKVITNL